PAGSQDNKRENARADSNARRPLPPLRRWNRLHARRRREEAAARTVGAPAAPVSAIAAHLDFALRNRLLYFLRDSARPIPIGHDAAHMQAPGSLVNVIFLDDGAIGQAAAMGPVNRAQEHSVADPVGVSPLVMRPPADAED